MDKDEIRKEFISKMQLNVTTTNLRNGKNWWNEYIDFLEEKVSKLHQHTVSVAVCQCKANRMIVRYEDKDWCNSCGELVKAN